MTALLTLDRLSCGRGSATILRELSLSIHPGHIVGVVGPNGAGKTTLLATIMGLLPVHAGHIRLDGRDITAAPTWRRARAGIALVPQGRRVFAPLTVAEHLRIAHRRPGPWTCATVLELLPGLRTRLHRRAGLLSGGEQQMLALARALLTNPRLLLLDEPTEGLAAAVASHVIAALQRLADQGTAVLITDHSAAGVSAVARDVVALQTR